MKYLIIHLIIFSFVSTYSVETKEFSLSKHIETIVSGLKKSSIEASEKEKIKHYLITQLELCKKEEHPEHLLLVLFNSSLKNGGDFIRQLEEVTNTNINMYVEGKKSQVNNVNTLIMIRNRPVSKKMFVKYAEEKMRDLAILQVINLTIDWLNKTKF